MFGDAIVAYLILGAAVAMTTATCFMITEGRHGILQVLFWSVFTGISWPVVMILAWVKQWREESSDTRSVRKS